MTDSFADEYGPRPPGVVWEFAARLCLLTDAHVGAARATPRHTAESDVDLYLDRDPRTGVPRLRGTTLAGLLRHELAARTADPVGPAALLGSDDAGELTGARTPAPLPSALDVDDAHAVLPDGAAVTVRVGTRVDPATGAVSPGRMWQWEVLPAGTVFTAHLRLRVGAPSEEARLLTLLVLAARGLGDEGPGIRIGGRSGRGYGAVRAARWAARRHDLTDEHGWFAYHARDWRTRWRQGEEALAAGDILAESGPAESRSAGRPSPGPGPAAHRAAADHRSGTDLAGLVADRLREHGREATAAHLAARAEGADRRRRAELRMELHVAERPEPAPSGRPPVPEELRPGLLMIGDTPVDGRLAEVDRAHRRRPFVTGADAGGGGTADTATGAAEVELRPVLGDTALFALFKRVGGRIARDAAEHLVGEEAAWREWHGHWWGADTDQSPGAPPTPSVPSRIRLRATPSVTGGAPLTTTRLTVDALFGDAVDGRLFTSDLHCGGSAEAVLDITEPDDAVRGLLALVVRELVTVPFDTLGAGSGSGNGRLVATRAVLVGYEGDGAEPHQVDLVTALTDPDSYEAAVVRGWLPALHRQITRGNRP
ncbi:RAMP superfamily CRISPR-associated protein [Nocardiopsis ganjiahuensis]|uniref:RAMP superfamily CRISPR-associated protein n=1 Tax=Nocardiopsis ganjiahuensis TaxID=239984 RepID=UPI000349A0BA|nr:RAMP superfamily CRISPR-associated protein [Nocardiopsis ganjiahuensis]